MNQIDNAIDEFSMLTRGDRVVVGLSGGADSVTLTHYLRFALGFEVVACHVNHGLRGDESDSDMEFVRQICSQWGIPLFVKVADVKGYASKKSIGLEEAGRQIRYATFDEVAEKWSAQKIATAHTLSDNVETILLNLTRGTGLQGLCGIPPKRDRIIRPLIYCTREDIEGYCRENGLSFVVDSTNTSFEYSRNNIRGNVIPVLKQLNPALEETVARSVKTLRCENDYLDSQAENLAAVSEIKPDCYRIDPIKLENKAIRDRLIVRFLNENNIAKSAQLIEKVDGMIVASRGKINVFGDKFIEVKAGMLSCYQPKMPIPYFQTELVQGKFNSADGEQFNIQIVEELGTNFLKKVYKKLLYIALDYDKIIGTVTIRQRKSGDSIEFSHRKGTHSLKKLFIEAKLSEYDKSARMVFCDEEGVVGVWGFGVSKRVAVGENTNSVLVIEKVSLEGE